MKFLMGVVLVIVISVLVYFLLFTGGKGIQAGTVVNKQHSAAYTELQMIYIPITNCYSTGKTQSCSTIMNAVPYYVHHPESWSLSLQDCGESTGKCRKGKVYVKESVWNQVFTGVWYGPVQGDVVRSPKDTKERAQ